MIWTKCDHIIIDSDDNGNVIDCDTNPCGWYTVLGLRYQELDENGKPYDECEWEEETVLAIVRNGIYCWRDETLKPCQKPQYCGRHKGKNYIIDVFNLTGCQDSVPAFKDELFKFSEEYNGDEWKVFEDNGEISREAGSAVENEWMDYFRDNYGINFQLEIHIVSQFWFHYAKDWEWAYDDITECWCPNWDEMYDDDWNFIGCEDGSTPECETYREYTHEVSTGGSCWRWGPNAEDLDYFYYATGGSYGVNPDCCGDDWPCYCETCEDWASTADSVEYTNEHIMETLKDRSKYILINSHGSHNNGSSRKILRDIDRGSICYDYSYTSSPSNQGLSDASIMGSQNYRFLAQDIYVNKTENTPEKAIGVKLNLHRKNIKRNYLGTNSDNDAIVSVMETDEEIVIYFNESDGPDVYLVPPHTYVNLISIIEAPRCQEGVFGTEWVEGSISPWYEGDKNDYKTETDEDRITFLEYIWKDEEK